jgi:hypothetical protein
MTVPIDIPPIDHHEAKLERALVDQFLEQQGRTRASLADLPDAQRAAILGEARAYAAERLAEIGARAHYVKEIHGEH